MIIRLILRENQIRRIVAPTRHRTSTYAVGSLVLFLLFAAGTVTYCARTLLSFKEMLCIAASVQTASDGSLVRATGCNGKILAQFSPEPIGMQYGDTLDYALTIAFGVIAQLVIFIADGLLVGLFVAATGSRC